MINLKKILIPTDFSEFSQHAIRYGCEFARKFEAKVHLINVVEDLYPIVPEPGMATALSPPYFQELAESSRRAIESLPASEMAKGVDIERVVVTGTPFLEIIRYAKEQDIDMIVIGTHGRSGLVQALMGSVAEKVVRKATCPVLTVRPEGHDFVMP
ncbi:hypothetical protein KOR42_10310 [Thalassoglobus neptunius]|uniref:Universal stress protein n=1 Tax=Thalassoglobus neptunius TaxID=1938619 RepID=A0A5C5X4L7_9PLAN|nr:universal stress protein [Thalassoglobus neptunius]TWT57668.1 hypothetical protein KOR42_10310 [Thalassoglobus neptunius]